MGTSRAFGPHRAWTDAELQLVKLYYAMTPFAELENMLPGRPRRVIQSKANALGLRRDVRRTKTATERREAKRLQMAQRRVDFPDVFRDQMARHRAKNRDAINERRRMEHRTRIFWTRALRLPGITARDLARMWKAQRGLCALSGEKLGRDAEVDHKIPLARSGGHELSNLQWVTPQANRAKRDLTDHEFQLLCERCAAWIGRRQQP